MVKLTSSDVVLLSQKSTSSKVGSGRFSAGMYRDSTVRRRSSVERNPNTVGVTFNDYHNSLNKES